MNTVLHFWNTLIQSNTFNFLVMLWLLCWIVKKFNIKEALEDSKNNIVSRVHSAEEEQINAQRNLNEMQSSVKNLDKEISDKFDEAKNRASELVKNIEDDTTNKIEQIVNNVEKVIKSEEDKISFRLTEKVAQDASELATAKLKENLNSNPKLHEKFIEESIRELLK